MRRMLAATVTATVLVCSGSAVGAQESDGGSSYAEMLIENADDSLGEDTTIAILRAYDRGYDLVQIIEGILGSSLAADGTITDEEGAAVEPSVAPAGVIAEDAVGSSGPVGGKARRAGPTSGEDIGLDVLERGVQKTAKKLDKKSELGARAAAYDASLQAMQGMIVLVLMSQGYSPDQVILDGFIAGGLAMSFEPEHNGITINGDNGKRLKPEFEEPLPDADAATAAAVEGVAAGLVGALSGDDPLTAAADGYKKDFTLTIDVDFVDDEGANGTIEGTARFGARKGSSARLAGEGTATLFYENKIGCSLSELDTTKYPYSVKVPLRVGIAGRDEGGKATLKFAVVGTRDAVVTGDDSAFCIQVVKDTADAYQQLITIPDVTVSLRDGAEADADNQDSNQPLKTAVAVQVREL